MVSCLAYTSAILAQSNQAGNSSSASAKADGAAKADQPAATFKVTTRMVTLEVVARDHRGKPVPGLTANDFQVFEEIGWTKEKHPQKIAAFRAVSLADIAAQDKGKIDTPAGVYTNLVTMQKNPVPPTVLLMDGLNTELASQMQIRRQMIRMLASIPPDIPVAVFLLGRQLHLVQNFTTDPKLLQSALQKASSLDTSGVDQVDPREDPDSMSAFMANIPGINLKALRQFERDAFAANIDLRVNTTVDALRTIARYVAGYPGRKNLLWISSSFPLAIDPGTAFGIEGMRNYQPQMQAVANELAMAKVAIYPMDPSGLDTSGVFKAGPQRGGSIFSGPEATDAIDRDDQRQLNRQQTMRVLAEQTGGQVCVDNNNLADCVKRAIDDGSSFYEISYYADATKWNDEFHKIIVKVSGSKTHLTYRQGYYPQPEITEQKSVEGEFRQAACYDLLTATSIIVAAKSLPPDATGNSKYVMVIDPSTLTFGSSPDGLRQLRLRIAACSFDKAGKPLDLVQGGLSKSFSEKDYSAVVAQRGILHTVVLPPVAGIAGVRLLVKDMATGRLGTVNVPITRAPPVAIFGAPAQPAH
jgi:VWFA-related protein